MFIIINNNYNNSIYMKLYEKKFKIRAGTREKENILVLDPR